MTKSFDRVSDVYDETRGYPPGVAEAICRWTEAELGLKPDRYRLLELGVGTGRIALPFILAGYDYTGVDISANMLGLFRQKLSGAPRSATLLHADITSLPLPNQSFDAVLAVHILHLVDPTQALAEVLRVTRPGGALVWGWDNSDSKSERAAIRKHYRSYLKQRGLQDESWDKNDEGRAWLAVRGIPTPEMQVAARWTMRYTARQVMDSVVLRQWSSTFDTPDDLHAEAAADLRAWAATAIGNLDAERTCDSEFRVHVFRLP